MHLYWKVEPQKKKTEAIFSSDNFYLVIILSLFSLSNILSRLEITTKRYSVDYITKMVVVTLVPLILIALLPLLGILKKAKDNYMYKKKYTKMLDLMQLPKEAVNVTKKELENLRKCFVYFDKDGGGSFSLEELLATMRELRLNPHEKEIQAMVEEADIDGDGEVTFEEFATVMM